MVVGLAVALVLVVFTGVYSAWTAGRLDRLHKRLDAARVALDAQLRERKRVAIVCGVVNRAEVAIERDHGAIELSHERERVENLLSRAIRDALEKPADLTPEHRAQLVDVVTRTAFTRRFHNDAVRDALVLRRRRIVRFLHVAGHAPLPQYFEIDDVAGHEAGEFSGVARASAPYD